jgi:hypothetical protein
LPLAHLPAAHSQRNWSELFMASTNPPSGGAAAANKDSSATRDKLVRRKMFMAGSGSGQVIIRRYQRGAKAPADPVRAALQTRLQRIVDQLVVGLSDEDAGRAVTAESDLGALQTSLQHAALKPEPVDAAVVAAYANGRLARQNLLDAEGGAVSGEEIGRELGGITRQAVDKRRHAGRLLALRERSDWLYPRWQVANGAMLSGFELVLRELTAGGHGPWDAMMFFLETDTARSGETPLEALRAGRVEAALAAARNYGVHRAV